MVEGSSSRSMPDCVRMLISSKLDLTAGDNYKLLQKISETHTPYEATNFVKALTEEGKIDFSKDRYNPILRNVVLGQDDQRAPQCYCGFVIQFTEALIDGGMNVKSEHNAPMVEAIKRMVHPSFIEELGEVLKKERVCLVSTKTSEQATLNFEA